MKLFVYLHMRNAAAAISLYECVRQRSRRA